MIPDILSVINSEPYIIWDINPKNVRSGKVVLSIVELSIESVDYKKSNIVNIYARLSSIRVPVAVGIVGTVFFIQHRRVSCNSGVTLSYPHQY